MLRQKFTWKCSTPKESINCRKHSFLHRRFFEVKPYATSDSTDSTRRSLINFGRGEEDRLQSAKDNFSQEEGGAADFSEVGGDAVEAREDFWSLSDECANRHRVVPQKKLACTESVCISKFRQHILTSWGKQKPFCTLWKRVSPMIYGTLMAIKFSLKVGSDPRDSDPEQTSTPSLCVVDDRLTKTQVTSRNDLAKSVVV